MRFTTGLACAALLAGGFLAAGCSSDEKKPAKPHHKDRISHADPTYDPAREPNPVISHDRAPRDTTSDRTADRSADRRGLQEVPTTAQRVDSAAGAAGALDYETSRDGVMYVYDEDADRVVFVGRMRDRERFRLDPEGGRALINSKTVYRGDLNPRHRYRLYFDRA